MNLQYKNLGVEIKAVNKTDNTVHAIFSTADIDRHGEIVDQKTWILDEFLKNPVVLFSHNHDIPAIGKVNDIFINDAGNLEGDVQFAVEEHEFAKTIYNLFVGGYMRAFSVGFMSEEVDNSGDNTVLKNNTLFELSAVNVPANAMALAKKKGLDVKALEKKQEELTAKKDDVVTVKPVVEENEKGAIADEIAADEVVETKYEWMDDVYEVLGAFWNLAYDENTQVSALPALLSETADLLKKIADGTYGEDDTEVDDAEVQVNTLSIKKSIKTVGEKQKAKMLMDFTKDGEIDVKSMLEAISEKAGKVLSTTNHAMIKESVVAMTKVLAANGEAVCPGCKGLHNPATCNGSAETETEVTDEEKSISADIVNEEKSKVETPVTRIASSAKKNSAREINKAIRALLAAKRKA